MYISHPEGVSEVAMTKPWYQQPLSTVFFNSFFGFFSVIGILGFVFWLGRVSKRYIIVGNVEPRGQIEGEIVMDDPDAVQESEEVTPPSPS